MAPDELISQVHVKAVEHCAQWSLVYACKSDRRSCAVIHLQQIRDSLGERSDEDLGLLGHNLAIVVTRIRILLGYEREPVRFGGTVCGDCGGVLQLAPERPDHPLEVVCVGTSKSPACGVAYPFDMWLQFPKVGA
jgi:hypothetical protein